MKKILVGAAGGSPSTNFIRSLREMNEKIFIVGIDCDEYTLHRSEADVSLLVPKANSEQYIPILNDIIKEYEIEFIYSQNDFEIEVLSKNRDGILANQFLPKQETIECCQDKYKSFQLWEKAGMKVPKTIMINHITDLQKAYQDFGPMLWLRDIKGAAGKGSYSTSNMEEAKKWIDFQNGWGHFTAAEYLSPDSITWSSIWNNGELIVAQSRKRLYWELSNRAPSGITGVTGTGMTFSDPVFDELAIKTITAIDATPHGIFSVDMTLDKNSIPNPTEINIGRFFTTHYFFTKAGLNLPEIFIKLAYQEHFDKLTKKINPLPNGLVWIRGVDFLPVFTDIEKIESSKKQLEDRIEREKIV